MGAKQTNFEKRFTHGFRVIYLEKQLEGEARKLQNQKLTKALSAVLAGILKREPTPDELSGCKSLIKKR